MHDYSIQSTTGLKTPLEIFFCNYSQRKRYSKISKIPSEVLQNSLFFPSVIGSSPEFLNSAKTNSKKSVFYECSKIPSWKLARKRSIMVSFYPSNRKTIQNLHTSKKHFTHFPMNVRKNCYFISFTKFQEKRLQQCFKSHQRSPI